MKTLNKLVSIGKKIVAGTILGTSLLFGGCSLPNINLKDLYKLNNSVTLNNPKLKTLSSGLNLPYGVSLMSKAASRNLQNVSLRSTTTPISEVYVTSPIIKSDDSDYISPPVVKQISGTIEDIINGTATTNDIYTFGVEDMDSFKHCEVVDPTNPDGRIETGLIIETALAGDGSVYVITSDSDTLFKISPNGDGTYSKMNLLTDDSLFGTTDMEIGMDGNLYLAQKKIISDLNEPPTVSRPNRLVKLDVNNLSLTTIAEMPNNGIIFPDYRVPASNQTYGGQSIIGDDLMKIAEDSNNFYFSDRFGGFLYSISKADDSVSTLETNVDDPYFLKIDSSGNLVYMTALHIHSGDDSEPLHTTDSLTIAQDPIIKEYSPSTGLEQTIFSLPDIDLTDFHDYLSTNFIPTLNNGFIPSSYIISGDLYEDSTTWNLFFLDPINGLSEVVSATKQ